MYKKIVILYFILFSFMTAKDIAVVGSFNTLHLGWKGKNIEQSAQVVSMFDLVALIEVMSEEGVRELKDALEKESGKKWEYVISKRAAGREKYQEYYAFIYQKDRVKLLKEHGFYLEKREDDFQREPYACDFKIGNFDFTFAVVHFTFGDEKSEREREAVQFGDVYDYFQKINGKENDLLLAGDFNLPAYDSSFKKLLAHKDGIFYAIDPSIKTTIGKNGFSSSYDNIFYCYKYTKEYTGNSGAFDFTNGNFKKVRKEISDHLPVYMEFYTDKDDD